MKASAMNIFITSSDPVECAIALDDVRLNKMILETAQLLSGAAWYLFKVDEQLIPDLYKLTHQNHPCAIWARTNKFNFLWLLNHFHALAVEKHYRTGKWHLSYTKLYDHFVGLVQSFYTAAEIELHRCATPDFNFDCSNTGCTGNIHTLYRICLVNKWNNDILIGRVPKWTKRTAPPFCSKHTEEREYKVPAWFIKTHYYHYYTVNNLKAV